MAETTPSVGDRPNASAGHVSVHLDDQHPASVPFMFEQQSKRLGSAVGVSVASHAVALVLVFILLGAGGPTDTTPPLLPEFPNSMIVWLDDPGPGGGGGGGGNQMELPPKPAELPGEDKITVPVVIPPEPEVVIPKEEPPPEPEPLPQLNIPAATLAAALQALPGVIELPAGPPTTSQGSGRGGGAGTGTGTGIGSGTGSGLGPGRGGGTGGGVYQPGNGVTSPQLISQVRPNYTADAMRAKIQGVVLLEAVVMPDGTVGKVEVLRGIDASFGLDEEAVKSARQWRFRPGTRMGEAVPVLVTIEVTFTIR